MGKQNNTPRFRMTARDRDLLRKVCLARALDRDSFIRFGFFSSVGRANARLTCLTRAGYLRRITFPEGDKGVRSVYLLGKSSIDLLAVDLDLDRAEIARLARHDPARSYIEHSLLIVEIHLAIIASCAQSGLAIEEFLHEATCRHEYTFVRGGKRVRTVVKPDALVVLSRGEERWHIYIEACRATVSASQERRAFERYVAYGKGVFQDTYGADTFTVCLVTIAGDRRIEHLVRLTKGLDGPAFRFTTMARVALGGFFASIWETLDSERPVMPIESAEVSL